MSRINEIEKRLSAIKQEMNAENADIDALTAETDSLIAERKAIREDEEKRSALLNKVANGEFGEGEPIMNTASNVIAANKDTASEKRAADFAKSNRMSIEAAETRSVLMSSGALAAPTQVSGINDLMGGVSSIIDMVNVQDCTGMSTNRVAYVVSDSSASDGTEGTAATESNPTFAYVDIAPGLINLTSYVSKLIKRQTPIQYESKVRDSALKALRKKAASKVTTAVTSSTIADEITTITSIDATTLRKIVMAYGPDDEVVGNAVLFLNKTDLVAFGDVRGTNEKKAVYEITADTKNPNCGTIKDGGLVVNYCINPNCTALTGTTNTSTKATKPTMFYGQPQCIELDLFGPYEVTASADYKFAEGLLAILGEAEVGAAVVVKNGILKISLPKKSS